MNILVTVNSNYIRPLKIMLTSFFVYHKNKNQIYLLYSNVTEEELKELRFLIEENGSSFFPVRMEESLLINVPEFRYFTREMYYRLFAGVIFPEEERMLYLDPDILIRDSLIPLYSTELGGNVLGAIADVAVNTLLSAHKTELGFGEEEQYINSGVLLMDLHEIRKCFHAEDIENIIKEKGEYLEYPDQDIINLIFRGRIMILERKYNYNTGYGSEIGMLKYILGGFLKERKYPVIVHYMGAMKPWHADYYGKFGKEYRCYLKKFPSTDLEVRREWKRRHLAVCKRLLAIVVRRIGGKGNE